MGTSESERNATTAATDRSGVGGSDAHSEASRSSERRGRPISAAKRRANAENAKRSTGPRTPEGKRVSARNALKHGVYAGADPIRQGPFAEDPKEVATFIDEIVEAMAPENAAWRDASRRYAVQALQDRRLGTFIAAAIELNTYVDDRVHEQLGWPKLEDLQQRDTQFDDVMRLVMGEPVRRNSMAPLARLLREVLGADVTTLPGCWDAVTEPTDEKGWHRAINELIQKVTADPTMLEVLINATAAHHVHSIHVTEAYQKISVKSLFESGVLEKIADIEARQIRHRRLRIEELQILERLQNAKPKQLGVQDPQ